MTNYEEEIINDAKDEIKKMSKLFDNGGSNKSFIERRSKDIANSAVENILKIRNRNSQTPAKSVASRPEYWTGENIEVDGYNCPVVKMTDGEEYGVFPYDVGNVLSEISLDKEEYSHRRDVVEFGKNSSSDKKEQMIAIIVIIIVSFGLISLIFSLV